MSDENAKVGVGKQPINPHRSASKAWRRRGVSTETADVADTDSVASLYSVPRSQIREHAESWE